MSTPQTRIATLERQLTAEDIHGIDTLLREGA